MQPLTFQFTQTLSNFNSFHWDFGDGTTSTSINPTHTFPGIGWYRVTLYAINACGTDSVSRWFNLCANASFTGPHVGCVGQTVQFQNTSSPGSLPATWMVNGSPLSTGQTFSWSAPADGTYSISMIVQNQTCTDTFTRAFVVTQPRPVLPADTSICDNSLITLQSGGGSWPLYVWSTGYVGVSIAAGPGTYWVEASDINGCRGYDSITIHGLPAPDASFGYVSNGLSTSFTTLNPSPGSYFWDFGDGDLAYSTNVTHTYAAPGVYPVCLRIAGFNGCGDSMCVVVPIVATDQAGPSQDLMLTVSGSDRSRIHVRASLPGPAAARFRLHDLAGRTLWAQPLPPAMDFDFEIPAQGWAAGCYLLSLEAGEGRVVRRVMLR